MKREMVSIEVGTAQYQGTIQPAGCLSIQTKLKPNSNQTPTRTWYNSPMQITWVEAMCQGAVRELLRAGG